uniref:Uncharacterized protein n=1 Tax=Myoviridae sp. ctBtT5 TaxID=2825048 RepID=A0A8S5Q0F8_9CAUD|nr:MAG TPA: hypothetical protein [Myoviridae sp. ctBtT5]
MIVKKGGRHSGENSHTYSLYWRCIMTIRYKSCSYFRYYWGPRTIQKIRNFSIENTKFLENENKTPRRTARLLHR